MDLSIAKSIYEYAKVVKNNKVVSDAERVIEEYSVFQRDNPSLPYIAPFCGLDHTGPIIKILTHHGEDKINAIIDALEPLIPKLNDDEYLIGKATIRSGALKGPVTIKIPKNQESVRQIEKQNEERNKTKELSLFLDSILKEANFRETEWLEFKTNYSRIESERLGRILSGLSNTASVKNVQYAYLIYGINEPKREISGTNFNTESNAWKNIELELRQSFNPSIKYEILEFNYNENPQQHIVIFKIYAAGGEPVAYCGVPFFRKDDKTIPLKDYPDLLKNISNSASQQPIDNNIIVIIQQPKFIFNINSGNTTIDSNNTNSNNNIDNSPNTNIGSNNQIEVNSKESNIKWLVTFLVSIMALLFGDGIYIKYCSNTETKTIVSSSSTDALNYSSEATYANHDSNEINSNHPTDSVKGILSDTINHLKKDTLLLVRKDTVIVIQKDTTINNLKNISLINEACVLYHDAKSIYPDGVHIAGDVESLANSFNKFAKKIKNDKIELCNTFDDGIGTLTECGRKILKTVKRELEIYIRNNQINCNQ